MTSNFVDYYSLLGVEFTADNKQIKKAYRKIALAKHPDRNPDDPNADRNFAEIVAAKEILLNPKQREKYNKEYGKYEQQKLNYKLQQQRFNSMDKERQILIQKLNKAEKEHTDRNTINNDVKDWKRTRIDRHLIEEERRIFAKLIEEENNRKLHKAFQDLKNDKILKEKQRIKEIELHEKYDSNCIIVKWDDINENQNIYNKKEFKSIFIQFGKMEFIDILSSKYCAQIVFKKRKYALKCMKESGRILDEFGLNVELKLKMNEKKDDEKSVPDIFVTEMDLWKYVQKPDGMDFEDYEKETYEMLMQFTSKNVDDSHTNIIEGSSNDMNVDEDENIMDVDVDIIILD